MVLAECRQPGASVAAVALSVSKQSCEVVESGRGNAAARLRFVPVELAAPASSAAASTRQAASPAAERDIRIELRRGGAPSRRCDGRQAPVCAAWLNELIGTALK